MARNPFLQVSVTLFAAVACLTLTVLDGASPGAAGTLHPIVPPHNPPANVKPVSSNFVTDLNSARTGLEGLAPLQLNWARFYRLSIAEQLFALANIDRVSRGLNAAVALTASLDAQSQIGAQRQEDPMPTITSMRQNQYLNYSSNWAQSPAFTQASLFTQFFWMYDDGPAPYWLGRNVDCATARSSGCWGHRDGILAPEPVQYVSSNQNCASTLYMGAASARMSWGLSNAEAFADATCPEAAGIVATWPEVATTLQLRPGESGFLATQETFAPASGIPVALASDTAHVWALVDQPRGVGVVREWSAASGALVRQVALSNGPLAITDDGTNLWVLATRTDAAVEISAATGAVLASVPVGQNPQGIASAGGLVWVSNYQDGTVTEIDAASGQVVATVTLPSPSGNATIPTAIASDPTHAWVAVDGPAIDEIDTAGNVVATIPVTETPSLLVDDGTDLWMSDLYHRITGLNEATGAVGASATTARVPSALAACAGQLVVVDGATTVYAIHSGTTPTLGAPAHRPSLASWFGPATCTGSTLWLGDQWNLSVDRVSTTSL